MNIQDVELRDAIARDMHKVMTKHGIAFSWVMLRENEYWTGANVEIKDISMLLRYRMMALHFSQDMSKITKGM